MRTSVQALCHLWTRRLLIENPVSLRRHGADVNVKALLAGVALAAMQMNKDNSMPCYSSSHLEANQPRLQQCTVVCSLNAFSIDQASKVNK